MSTDSPEFIDAAKLAKRLSDAVGADTSFGTVVDAILLMLLYISDRLTPDQRPTLIAHLRDIADAMEQRYTDPN